jgi:hypothetical protein
VRARPFAVAKGLQEMPMLMSDGSFCAVDGRSLRVLGAN